MTDLNKPGNVSAVRHRSPWRYPGGKTWLIPRTRQWLAHTRPPALARTFVEPFAGGGSVGLDALFGGECLWLVLVELDPEVANVWHVITRGDWQMLCHLIRTFEFNDANVRSYITCVPQADWHQAFRTILRNRVNHGGILAGGASTMKEGEGGRGMKSRWYAETLARRIEDIAAIGDRIRVVNGCGLEYMAKHYDALATAWFIDPPYTVASKRLYKHWEVDHDHVFQLAAQLKSPLLLTYDNTPEVQTLATTYGLPFREVAMRGRRNTVLSELLISRNFDWLDTPQGKVA